MFQRKAIGLLALLCTLGSSCGDIVKIRNPTKKVNTPEPETKTSALYGVCTNFHGAWTVQCPEPVEGIPSSFQLLQYFCDLVILQPQDLSFEKSALSWSDARDTITLRAGVDTIVLEKRGSTRQGTWSHGDQSCPMSWSRNP